jgi:hypothetical protein
VTARTLQGTACVRGLGRVCACWSRESEALERGIPLIRRWEVGVPVHELRRVRLPRCCAGDTQVSGDTDGL